MRYGKPYWDYDPCEVCNRDDCKGCEYYFTEREEEWQKDTNCKA